MTAHDIEIYLQDTSASLVLEWLAQRFPGASAARPAGKKQWKLIVPHQGQDIPVLVIEDASPGFTSLWLDSPHTPWANDIACAREAFAHFGHEIRATSGSWTEGDDPDLWWHINPQGEGLLHWQG